MAWTIELEPPVVRELSKTDPQIVRRILIFLHERVAVLEDPRSIGEALKGTKFGEFWKYRVSHHRYYVVHLTSLLNLQSNFNNAKLTPFPAILLRIIYIMSKGWLHL